MSVDLAGANILVERLVASVARAFYTDSYVVVLDTVLREKFIRFEELGPRLKVSPKDLRAILNQLEDEMMIHVENMIMEDGGTARCYYIDYQLFVHVVRFRLHLMTAGIKSVEKSELSDVFFECPTCKQRYSALEAQHQLAVDFKFICTSCCPFENFRAAVSQPSFRLVEVDNRYKLSDVQVLAKRMEEQLSASEHHDSIFDLLHALKDVPLIRNRPSDNRLRGITASRIIDEDVKKEANENIGYRKLASEAKNKGSIAQSVMGQLIGSDEFQVTFDEPGNSFTSGSSGVGGNMKRPRDTAYPEFLKSSRVVSAPVLAGASASTSATVANDNSTIQGTQDISGDGDTDEAAQAGDDIDWED